jgi:hypothetical protein
MEKITWRQAMEEAVQQVVEVIKKKRASGRHKPKPKVIVPSITDGASNNIIDQDVRVIVKDTNDPWYGFKAYIVEIKNSRVTCKYRDQVRTFAPESLAPYIDGIIKSFENR